MQGNMNGAKAIALFCRLQMYTKNNTILKGSEIGILSLIHYQICDPRVTSMAKELQTSKAMVTKTIDVLVEKDLLYKSFNEKDRRTFQVTITPKGRDTLQESLQGYMKNIFKLQNGMGTERYSLFVNLLEEANEILKEN